MAKPLWSEIASNSSPISFGGSARAVTPHDSTNLDPIAKAVNVTSVAGGDTLTIVTTDDSVVAYTGVTVGFSPPYHVKRVNSTGTTATVYTVD